MLASRLLSEINFVLCQADEIGRMLDDIDSPAANAIRAEVENLRDIERRLLERCPRQPHIRRIEVRHRLPE